MKIDHYSSIIMYH